MASYIPEGYHTVTPYMVVDDIDKVIQFMISGLDGELILGMKGPDGKIIHAEVKIGNSHVMLGQVSEQSSVNKSMLYIYTEDCDALFEKAKKAGGTIEGEMKDQYYGDRSGGVTGPCGNSYWIATHKEALDEKEVKRRMTQKS